MLSLLMLISVGMYLFNHDEIAKEFVTLGFPAWLVYPLAVAKLLGVLAILTRRSAFLKEWAYAGFFFDVLLACVAHVMVGDGEQGGAIIGIVLVVVSYGSDGLVNGNAALTRRAS
ncbi:MAG: DoxX family protein [Myxococcota bacterium]